MDKGYLWNLHLIAWILPSLMIWQVAVWVLGIYMLYGTREALKFLGVWSCSPFFVLAYKGVGLKTANQTADCSSWFSLYQLFHLSSWPCVMFFVAKTLFCILQELQSLKEGRKAGAGSQSNKKMIIFGILQLSRSAEGICEKLIIRVPCPSLGN